MRDQREVFPGLDSGPNCSEGHYFYILEKRPSGPSLYTTTFDLMLLADNHKDIWVFVHEVVISCILNKGGAEENDVVKLPPEGAPQLVYKVLCLS